MTKKITIGLLLASLIIFSGCDIPLLTKYKVKKYILQIEPSYRDVREKSDKAREVMENDKSTTAEAKKELEEVLSAFQDAQDKTNSRRAPTEARDLQGDLKEFYEKSIDFTENVLVVFDFMIISETAVLNLQKTSDKLPTDFDDKALEDTAAELKKLQGEQQKTVSGLKDKKADELFEGAKEALVEMNQAYLDILSSMITGIEKRDTTYFNTSSFEKRFQNAIDSFSVETKKVTEDLGLEEKSGEINELKSKIDKGLNDLRVKYKI